MRKAALLVGGFALTLAILVGVYLVVSGGGSSSTAVVPSPTPSPAATATPTPRPKPSATPAAATPTPTPTAFATEAPQETLPPGWSPKPITSGTPGMTPVPDTTTGAAITITIHGADFDAYDVQPHSSVTKSGNAVVLTSSADDSQPTSVVYTLPKSAIPSGKAIARLDTVVCGSGGGNFFEVYGPDGSQPVEFEAPNPPKACWQFTRSPGTDTSVHADVQLQSRFQIDSVTYTVWVR
jgi:hypothetical protein